MPKNDDLLAALVHAIASDLIDLGYRATVTRGYVERKNELIRLVADEVWCSMNNIATGARQPAGVQMKKRSA